MSAGVFEPPARVKWNYDRVESVADALVHGVGLVLALIGFGVLIVVAIGAPGVAGGVDLIVYGLALLLMLTVSGLYNHWPPTRVKWILRRFDHAAIFVLIAATYTPFVVRHAATPLETMLPIWGVALTGAALKIALPGRFDRAAVLLYLALGWSGLTMLDTVFAALPGPATNLVIAGGIVYSAGIAFHLWESLRFHNAIWHGFVLAASMLFFCAVVLAALGTT